MSKQLKLMSDYDCFPLWEIQDGGRNLNPDDLLLSDELKSALRTWSASFDRTLNHDYPPDSGFAGPEEEAAFEAEGLRLWQELQRQLCGVYEVVYYSQQQSQVLDHLPARSEGHPVPTAENIPSGSVEANAP